MNCNVSSEARGLSLAASLRPSIARQVVKSLARLRWSPMR